MLGFGIYLTVQNGWSSAVEYFKAVHSKTVDILTTEAAAAMLPATLVIVDMVSSGPRHGASSAH